MDANDFPAIDFTRIIQRLVTESNTTEHYISYKGGSLMKRHSLNENLHNLVPIPKYGDLDNVVRLGQ